MSITSTAWRLVRPNGRPTRCLLSETDGRWDVIIWNGPSIVLWERRGTRDAAVARADELWTTLVAYGCLPAEAEPDTKPPAAPFARACPDCGAADAHVRHRRGGFLVMFCADCQRAWNSRERVAAADRRAARRQTQDRRQAA